ncbi:MAG: MBL fold metallo-hydrolase, partial [Ignavibacteriaceae bacterium]|nr:MBL fold metallo-hydrolase [Ignavibacteriaceae bacterium]
VSDNKKILIDTGMGDKWEEKSKSIYKIEQQDSALDKAMHSLGFSANDITDVILTHLHFDHTGGSTKEENGKLVPTFANANYHVQKQNYDWAINATERDKGSYLKENFEPLLEHGVINFLDGQGNFDDEISFKVINGHTFGQQMVKISDSINTLLYCGDLFPFTAHIRLPYIMGYDLQPLVTLKEKKELLPKAAKDNWMLFFEHDPVNAAATVKFTEKGITTDKLYASF